MTTIQYSNNYVIGLKSEILLLLYQNRLGLEIIILYSIITLPLISRESSSSSPVLVSFRSRNR